MEVKDKVDSEAIGTDRFNNMNQKVKEPIYFSIAGRWYKGKMPSFYDNSRMEMTRILESNYEKIRQEILSFCQESLEGFIPQYVPSGYENDKWKVLTFYGLMLKYPENIKKFPVLCSILEQVPGLVTAQISVLDPHTRVKAHFGGSNALIRSHLGIVIPGKYPELGFRIRREDRCWEEGKLLSFCEAHRHFVWNNSDHKRMVLLIDTVHPDYMKEARYISAGVLAVMALKMFMTRFPFTRKFPVWLTVICHKMFILLFITIIGIQRTLNVNLTSFLQNFKMK